MARPGNKIEYKERDICPVTGKRMFSRKDAGDCVHAAKRYGKKKKVPLRVYYCKYCNNYHLTHYKSRKKGVYD